MMDEKFTRIEELRWYGLSQEQAEKQAGEQGDITLTEHGFVSLVLNDDLRYGIMLRDCWYGLEEMQTLLLYLDAWTTTLGLLVAFPRDGKLFVPPGKVLSRDEDAIAFFFEKGEHQAYLDGDFFPVADIATLYEFLSAHRKELERMIARNATSPVEKYPMPFSDQYVRELAAHVANGKNYHFQSGDLHVYLQKIRGKYSLAWKKAYSQQSLGEKLLQDALYWALLCGQELTQDTAPVAAWKEEDF